eukprot:3436734-Pleurochrysis_carterae.AAC.3
MSMPIQTLAFLAPWNWHCSCPHPSLLPSSDGLEVLSAARADFGSARSSTRRALGLYASQPMLDTRIALLSAVRHRFSPHLPRLSRPPICATLRMPSAANALAGQRITLSACLCPSATPPSAHACARVSRSASCC